MQNILNRTIRAYARCYSRSGAVFAQPCRYASNVSGNVVTLANTSGIFAQYEWNGARLRHVAKQTAKKAKRAR